MTSGVSLTDSEKAEAEVALDSTTSNMRCPAVSGGGQGSWGWAHCEASPRCEEVPAVDPEALS